jgi:lactoylglutathione lyase
MSNTSAFNVEEKTEPKPQMSLVVIYARDIERTKQFYDDVGLSFTSERHGTGPAHYAASMGTLVFEIYPCRSGEVASPLRIGFRVPSVDGTVETLRQRGVKIVASPKDSTWGRRAVVEDPDGNRVELAQ